MGRVFANGPGDLASIPGRVIPKTLKVVLDTSLLNTRQYKVRIKGKVEQFRERCSFSQHLSVVAIEKGDFWVPSTTIANLSIHLLYNWFDFNFFFHFTDYLTMAKESSLSHYLPIAWRRTGGFIPFPRTLVQRETITA